MKKYLSLMVLSILLCSCNYFSGESKELKDSIERGEIVYNDNCLRCHIPNSTEVPNRYPPLVNSNWLTEKRKESIHAVKYGLRGPIEVNGEPYNDIMVPMALSDEQVTDVLNYVMNSWGNTQEKRVTVEEVKAVPKKMNR